MALYRYWIFFVLLAGKGAFFSTLCFLECVLLGYLQSIGKPPIYVAPSLYEEETLRVFQDSWVMGISVGAIIALVAMIWDQLRNKNYFYWELDTDWRFLANFFWCEFYALILIAFGGALSAALQYCFPLTGTIQWTSPIWVICFIAFLSCPLANFLAPLWATIRTINTEDVITPAVLWQKLHRSTQLEEA